MSKTKIDYDTILACKAGDSDALNLVLAHYDGMINAAASKTVIDETGKAKVVLDLDAKQNIQQTLMLQVFLKYDHLADPSKAKETKNGNRQKGI